MSSCGFMPIQKTPRQKPHIKKRDGFWRVQIPTFGSLPQGSTVKAYKFVREVLNASKETGE